MARRPRDLGTPLLDWEMPEVAPKFEEIQVRSVSLRGRISKAVSTAMQESGLDRAEIAVLMSSDLGETVSEAMLNNWASETKENQHIPVDRLISLVKVTGDIRVFQAIAEGTGFCVIKERYKAAIEQAILDEQIEKLKTKRKIANQTWTGPR